MMGSIGLGFLCLLAFGGNPFLEKANSAFSSLNFEEALQLLEKALAVPNNERHQLLTIYEMQGKCLLSLRRKEEATHAFRIALSIDPTFRLHPDSSPRYLEPFRKILKSGVPALVFDISAPATVTIHQPVLVSASLTVDPAQVANKLVFHYRRNATAPYTKLRIGLKPDQPVSFYLPPGIWRDDHFGSIDWYAEITNQHGGILQSKGDPLNPLQITVTPPKLPPKEPVGLPIVITKETKSEDNRWYGQWWVWTLAGSAALLAGGLVAWAVVSQDTPSHRDFSLIVR